MQNRLRSLVTWSAIIAQIISIGQLSGLWAKFGVDAGALGNIAAGILQLFVLFGILNNPTDSQKF